MKGSTDGGYVRVKSRHSGRCIAVTGANAADGTALIQTTGTAISQQWRNN